MANQLKKHRNKLILAEAFSLLLCFAIIFADIITRNGDGIIDKFHINAIIVFFMCQIFILPLLGMTSSNIYLSNLSLGVFLLVFVLVAIEILLRFFPLSATNGNDIENLGPNSIFSKYDTVYFKNYFPNAKFNTHIDNLDTTYAVLNQINSDGFRGAEVENKKEGEQRILLLGDSFMQSDEVEYTKTIGQQLEKLLGDSVSVFQHGQPSWSPLLELNWLLKKGKKLDLDQIVLFLFPNDFFSGQVVGDKGYTPYARFDKDGYPLSFDFSSIKTNKHRNAWSHFLEQFKYLQTYRVFISISTQKELKSKFSLPQVENLLQLPPKDFHQTTLELYAQNNLMAGGILGLISTSRDSDFWDVGTKKRLNLSEQYLSLMKTWLSSEGIDLSIVLIPHPFEFLGENEGTRKFYGFPKLVFPQTGLQDRLQDFCQKNQIPFLPLHAGFDNFKKENEEPLYFYHDGHWNATGHRLAAENVLFFLNTTSQNSFNHE
ncbi:hypothetical protein OAF63_06230 [Saprospiraceae bacterium]|nr:hypothetical protein [Saprospiraceae bacterium]